MSENTNSCDSALIIAELRRDAERNSEQHREFYAKFNELDKKQAIQEERYTNILQTVSETKDIVTDLKDKPTKRWETVITSIITSLVGLLIGFLLSGVIH